MQEIIEFAASRLTNYLTREIADGNAMRAWGRVYAAMPNPDPVLRKTGQPITILDEIRRENHVASCSESREAAVTKKKWAIERADASQSAYKTIDAVFKNLPIRDIVREICEAWGYGYQVSEIVWKREGGLLLPERVSGKPRRWFLFGQDGALRIRTSSGDMNGTPVEPYKFLVTQHRASYENPYGESKYSSCFWPVTFKKGGLKFWAVFLEKFGMPHIIGKQPRSASDAERDKLLQSLVDIARDAVAVIPDDSSIEVQNPNIAGSTDAFERFAAYHDGEISTAILGHSAAATSTPGRLGGEDMALQVRADIVDNDAGMVEATLNKLIKYIHEVNPSLGAECPNFILYDPKDIDKPRAERDALLLNTGKVRFTKKYYVEKYDFAEDEIEVVENDFHAPPQFSAPQKYAVSTQNDFQDAVDSLADGLPDNDVQSQAETLLNPVLTAVENADSFDDLQNDLSGLYDVMDSSAVEKCIEKSVLLGEVWGAASYRAKEESI